MVDFVCVLLSSVDDRIVGGYKLKWAVCVDLRLVPSFSYVVLIVVYLPCVCWICRVNGSFEWAIVFLFHIECLHFIENLDEMFSATLFCDGLKQRYCLLNGSRCLLTLLLFCNDICV